MLHGWGMLEKRGQWWFNRTEVEGYIRTKPAFPRVLNTSPCKLFTTCVISLNEATSVLHRSRLFVLHEYKFSPAEVIKLCHSFFSLVILFPLLNWVWFIQGCWDHQECFSLEFSEKQLMTYHFLTWACQLGMLPIFACQDLWLWYPQRLLLQSPITGIPIPGILHA